ncbi:unnamed protein product [Spirodela intermedia]|uniref:Glutamate receptor n=1 Tax=Spirodela intermedia TaxID=51605 RepID=A0A7I8JJN8_SPIIN|nr:unnamed protein product [Spirodela intermedia]CAA6670290.1 unnamed protein product [Spirodela intermedia]
MRRAASPMPLLSNSLFIFLLLFPSFSAQPSRSARDGEVIVTDESPSPFKVGVVLNLRSPVGKMSRLCMEIAVSDFYLAHTNYTTRLDLRFRESQRDPVTAASAAVDLMINERVQAIVGPQTSDEASFVVDLGNRSKVPVISFSATSPSVSPVKTPFFVRTAVNDSSQAKSIAALVRKFGWKQVVPIYEQSEYGTGMMPYIVDAIKAVGARAPYSSSIPPSASDDFISKELYKLMNMESRVFLVHMTTRLALRFFAKANEARMMSKGFAWILSEGLTSLLGTVEPSVLRKDLLGVVGLKPHVVKSNKLQDFKSRWLRDSRKENPLSDISDLTVYGLWAYDTVWALAMAAEKVGAVDPGYSQLRGLRDPPDLTALGFSNTGERLLDEILRTEFTGVSGHFQLIVNVVGEAERTIGFWTEDRLTRDIDGDRSSPSTDELSTVIWPGDTVVVPKGWVNPMIGKKLKILVPGPVDPGFHPFLRADPDPQTGKLVVSGFAIEVFEAALEQLPYAFPVEYFQLHRPDGMPSPKYNDLVRQVFEQKFDGLVGDVTITANRSNYADFTLPYTTSAVSMVVPLRDDRRMSAWIFMRPLSGTLWIVSGAFFVFTGLVVWILEHRVNDDFRGPLGHQIGTASYFIFSTLVFSHKEKMVSNLSRVVVIIWVFVVLVLQSSYTASLTSMLTFKELIRREEYVGYLRNSFTRGVLLEEGFKEEKLKPFKSPEEYREALSKGSRNGGVGAIVDEIPYLRFFLKDHCNDYTMAGPRYKAGGFGFVFPKGSPLVPDLSRAILEIAEGDRMVTIEKRWFGDLESCVFQESSLTSDSLNFANFWGLFLITGVASGAAFLAFSSSFVYQKLQAPRETDSGETLWQKVTALTKSYNERDLNSYTFRKQAKDERRSNKGDSLGSSCGCGGSARDPTASPFTDRSGYGMASPYTSGCPTPLSNFNQTEGGTPVPNLASPPERGSVSYREHIEATRE